MNTKKFKKKLKEMGISPGFISDKIDDLVLMADFKYDDYEMYAAAVRFSEHILAWLQQFREEHREMALRFVCEKLVFISQTEMHDLQRFLYHNKIVPELLKIIIHQEKLEPFAYAAAFKNYFTQYLRRCLFVGLSDGSKIDFIRRHHDDIGQEQVLPYYRTPATEYLKILRAETGIPNDNFHTVFLIDDFTGSGSTLIRFERSDSGETMYDGILMRVFNVHKEIMDQASNIYLCHYVATENAIRHVNKLTDSIQSFRGKIKTLTSLILKDNIRIIPGNNLADSTMKDMMNLCEIYYKREYEDEITLKKGGVKFGYGDVGLPLVLFSNTPNNSIYLLWYNSENPKLPFSGLFNRKNRHKPIRK